MLTDIPEDIPSSPRVVTTPATHSLSFLSLTNSRVLHRVRISGRGPVSQPYFHRPCHWRPRCRCAFVCYPIFLLIHTLFLCPLCQYASAPLHGRDQPPGGPRVTDGAGAIRHRARCDIRLLDRIFHARKYAFLPVRAIPNLMFVLQSPPRTRGVSRSLCRSSPG